MLALTCPCTALSLSLSLLCRSTGMSSLSRRLLCRSIFCFRCRVLLLRISFLFLFFVYFVIIATSAATALRSPLLRFWPPFLSVSAAAAAVALPSPVRMRGFVLLLQWFLIFTALYNFNQCVWSALAHTEACLLAYLLRIIHKIMSERFSSDSESTCKHLQLPLQLERNSNNNNN